MKDEEFEKLKKIAEDEFGLTIVRRKWKNEEERRREIDEIIGGILIDDEEVGKMLEQLSPCIIEQED